MTQVPPPGSGAPSGEEPDQPTAATSVPPLSYGSYPRLFGQEPVKDDELTDALAAQTAMYTGPITIPVLNDDPGFTPDPAEREERIPPPQITLPPVPVPSSAPPPDFVAPDVLAAAPSSAADSDEDETLSRSVESEAAAGSTLDAILLLENELRRRQGLPPVDNSADILPAHFAPPAEESAIPGWTPAPHPEHEGSAPPHVDASAFELPPAIQDPGLAPEEDGSAPWVDAPPPVLDSEPIEDPAASPQESEPQPDLTQLPPPESKTLFASVPPILTVTPAAPESADLTTLPPPTSSDLAPGAPPPPTPQEVSVVSETGVTAVAREDDEVVQRGNDSLALERTGLEPTPLERRAGHSARLFWLWFAANSSVVMVAVGAILVGSGMSLRQVLIAIIAGVALSALPLGLGTLAGKWSGQPTMLVSRASFGVIGNLLPALLAVVSRALWGGVTLWLLASTAGELLTSSNSVVVAGIPIEALLAAGLGVVLATLVAVFGYGLLHRVQRILGILATLLLVMMVALTADHIDLGVALQTPDGPWRLAIGGVTVVFSVVGLAWAQSSSDLARYQRPEGSGAANMLWGSFGVIVPTLLILAWGAFLAASDPELAAGLATAPLSALLALAPEWFTVPLFAVASFGLFSAVIVTTYSGGLAILAAGVRMPRPTATTASAILVAATAGLFLVIGADTRDIVSDAASLVAVPVAAWAGIFASETMIRVRRFHTPSLLATGGVYPAVRWVNLIGLLAITAVGYGFTTSQLSGIDWQGYLFTPLGVGVDSVWRQTDAGILLALALGVLLPLVAGIPAIRRQERTRGLEALAEPGAGSLVD